MRLLETVAEIAVGVPACTPAGTEPRERMLTVRAVLPGGGLDAANLAELRVLGNLSDAVRVRAGDVLVPARSTRLLAAVVPESLAGIAFNATLLRIRCGPALHPRLLAAYLMTEAGQAAVLSLAQSGTAQLNLTVRALAQLPVPVPPPARQQKLVAMLAAADEAYAAATAAAAERRRLAYAAAFDYLPHEKDG